MLKITINNTKETAMQALQHLKEEICIVSNEPNPITIITLETNLEFIRLNLSVISSSVFTEFDKFQLINERNVSFTGRADFINNASF